MTSAFGVEHGEVSKSMTTTLQRAGLKRTWSVSPLSDAPMARGSWLLKPKKGKPTTQYDRRLAERLSTLAAPKKQAS